MKTRLACALLLVSAVAGSPSYAQLSQTVTGGWNNLGFDGTDPGFIYTNTGSTSILFNNFGGVFTGPASVSAFFITQYDDPARARPKTLEFYNGTTTVTGSLANSQAAQTITFDTPINASLGWLAVRVIDRYAGFTDANFGIDAYGFNGTLTDTGTNFNLGLTPSITGGLGGGYTRPAQLTNNVLLSNSMTDLTGSYFAKDAGVDSILMTYAEAKDVGSIGLGFETGVLGSERLTPKFVTLVGLDAGNNQIASQQINLFENLQFGRYSVSGFTGVSKLRLDFPNGSNNSDWYLRTDNGAYGVSEFQAMSAAIVPVPEPTGMALAAIGVGGLLVGLRRRRS